MTFTFGKTRLSKVRRSWIGHTRPIPSRPRRNILGVELLETRLTPSSAYFYNVTTVNDGAGSLSGSHAGTQADPFQAATLLAAVTAATADGGTDTIEFDPSLTAGGPATIALSTVGDNTFGPSDFGISTNITIQGPAGSNGITLDNSGSQRLFYVSPAGSLTLENLTLTTW